MRVLKRHRNFMMHFFTIAKNYCKSGNKFSNNKSLPLYKANRLKKSKDLSMILFKVFGV